MTLWMRTLASAGALGSVLVFSADAATLWEWESAKKTGGSCGSIPFSQLQTQCSNYDRDVSKYCKGEAGPSSCSDQKKMAEGARIKYREAKSNHDSSSDTVKRNEYKKIMDDEEKLFKKQKDDSSSRLDISERCLEALRKRDSVWKDAISGADYDINRDSAVAPIATQLRAGWIQERERHLSTSVVEALNGVNNCRTVMSIDL